MTLMNRKFTISIIILIMIGSLLLPAAVFASKVSEGTSIGGITLEGLTIKEAEEKLEQRINQWQTEGPLQANNEFESLEISKEIFQFDHEGSIDQLSEKMNRNWSTFFIKPKHVQQELFVSLNPEAEEILNWPAHVDIETTLNHALLQASNLANNSVSLVYIEGSNVEQEEIAVVSLEIPDISEATVEYLIENLNEQILEPNTLYSFLEENTLPNGMANAKEEMSFLGSAFYELVLHTNIEIIERHSQQAIPSYTEAGLEVEINREKELDLRLYHENNFAFTVNAVMDEGIIELSLEAATNTLDYDFSRENEVEIEPRKIYRYNKNLQPGTEEVVQEGEPGLQIEIYRSTRTNGEPEAERELIARDYYPPVPEIIERSVITETETSEEQIAEQAPSNEEMQIVTPEFDSIVERWMPQIDERQALCEEDPSNPDCQHTHASLLPLLLSCMMNGGPSSQTDVEADNEEPAETSSSSFCDLFIFFLLLSMADNDLLDEEAEYTDENFFNNDDWTTEDWETETDLESQFNEEETEEVRY